jgi:arylsulfatase A-like enzyme
MKMIVNSSWPRLLGCAAALAVLPTGAGLAQTTPTASPPNVLLIIGDDMGVETLASYGVGARPPATPNLDRLADEGVRFDNFWSQPVCSPTRATLLTGRYGFRTGVGQPTGDGSYMGPEPPVPPKPADAPAEGHFPPGAGSGAGQQRRAPGQGAGPAGAGGPRAGRLPPGGPGLRLDEYALPQAFAAHPELGYATAAIGKWHLADPNNGWQRHPNLVGFDYFSGLIRGFPESYFAWLKVVNGEFSGKTGYTPDDKVDDAIHWIDAQAGHPWFLWFAFNLPHMPLHRPPAPLWVTDHAALDPKANPDENPQPYFAAMMEAMDTEIGRLLAALPPTVRANTYVIFMGDNGSARQVVSAPFPPNHAKGTVYEGGVNVPLIITGPAVAHDRVSGALVNSTDLFSTILDMAGIDTQTTVPKTVTLDSVSIFQALSAPEAPSRRTWIYADNFSPNEGIEHGRYAIRGERYKLIVSNGQEELYDLSNDRAEQHNLLAGTLTPEQKRADETLRAEVDALHASEAPRH